MKREEVERHFEQTMPGVNVGGSMLTSKYLATVDLEDVPIDDVKQTVSELLECQAETGSVILSARALRTLAGLLGPFQTWKSGPKLTQNIDPVLAEIWGMEYKERYIELKRKGLFVQGLCNRIDDEFITERGIDRKRLTRLKKKNRELIDRYKAEAKAQA